MQLFWSVLALFYLVLTIVIFISSRPIKKNLAELAQEGVTFKTVEVPVLTPSQTNKNKDMFPKNQLNLDHLKGRVSSQHTNQANEPKFNPSKGGLCCPKCGTTNLARHADGTHFCCYCHHKER